MTMYCSVSPSLCFVVSLVASLLLGWLALFCWCFFWIMCVLNAVLKIETYLQDSMIYKLSPLGTVTSFELIQVH